MKFRNKRNAVIADAQSKKNKLKELNDLMMGSLVGFMAYQHL